MFAESLRAILRTKRKTVYRRKLHQHSWIHGLPMKVKFRTSGLYISAIPALIIGACVGVLAAIMAWAAGSSWSPP